MLERAPSWGAMVLKEPSQGAALFCGIALDIYSECGILSVKEERSKVFRENRA